MRTRMIGASMGSFLFLCASAETGLGVGSGGLTNQVAGARALGQANAVVARVNDASSISFNPAGIAMMNGTELTIGVTPQFPQVEYQSPDGYWNRAASDMSITPNLYAASRLGSDRWAFGVGWTAPYGLRMEWSAASPLRFVSSQSGLEVFNFEPTVAYRLGAGISVGAGVDYFLSPQLAMVRSVDTGALDGPGSPEAVSVMEAKGDGWGFSLGLAASPGRQHRIGLAYRSPVTVDYAGDLALEGLSGTLAHVFGGQSYTTAGSGSITFPRTITLGYAFLPARNWALELDAEWTEWSSFDEVAIAYAETDPIRLSLLNVGNPSPRAWQNVWSLALGAEYELRRDLFLRGGYFHYDSPVPNLTFEPSTPDSDVNGFTLGAGFTWSSLTLDLAYQAFFFRTRFVDNDMGQESGASVDGTYDIFASSLGVNLALRF